MKHHVTNALLAVIAVTLIFIAGKLTRPAEVKIVNDSIPVEFDQWAELNVNITGIDVNRTDLHAEHDVLPVSIDGVNKNPILNYAVPVKIER